MASIHELEWEMAKMFETVKIEDIFRYYPFCEGSEHQKVMSKFEQEELFFWAQGETSMTLFTTFVAYLNLFIIHPKCCEKTRAQFKCSLPIRLTPKFTKNWQMGKKYLNQFYI